MFLIHTLAKKAGLSCDTIRFYEKKSLLHPIVKAENGYRYYDDTSLRTLMFIKNCRRLDISIQEIQQLFALLKQRDASCQSVNLLVENHLQQIEQRIAELNHFKQQLQSLRNSYSNIRTIDECQILKQLVELSAS